MSYLGTLISDELKSLGWDRLMPQEGNVQTTDIRKWTCHAMSKAIWKFAYERYTLNLIANGSFVNNSNYQATQASVPYPQPTVGISLTGWLRIPSHKKLYDILLPWMKQSDNPPDVWIDTFQRIFIDWFGVLEVQAGQDGQTPLPIIPSPTFNPSPPYFHSINGSTLDSNKFVPPIENPPPSAYPIPCSSSPSGGMSVPPIDTGIQDAKDSESSRWDSLRATAVSFEATALTNWTNASGTTDPTQLEALRQPYRDRWQVSLEALRTEQGELRGESSPNTTRLTEIDGQIQSIHDNALSYVDTDYPSATARIEMIDYEKGLATSGSSVPPVVPPIPLPVGETNPDAPEIGNANLLEPNAPDYEWPPIVAWYSTPPKITFPTCASHGQACYDELSSSNPASMEEAWGIIGKHLANAFNDHLKAVGGGSGYAYGLPVNPWNGSILIVSCVWDDA